MSACSTNPAQRLAKYEQRDTSLQKDRIEIGQRQPAAFRPVNVANAGDFRAFVQPSRAPAVDYSNPAFLQPYQNPDAQASHSFAKPQNSEWVTQFSNLDLNQHHPNAQSVAKSSETRWSPPGPQGAHPVAPQWQPRYQQFPMQMAPSPSTDPVALGHKANAAWENAFDEAEKSALNQLQQHSTGNASRPSSHDDDISKAAAAVKNTLHTEVHDDATRSRLQQSTFMSLLDQLEREEIHVDPDKLTDSSGTAVDVHTLPKISAAEQADQRDTPDSLMTEATEQPLEWPETKCPDIERPLEDPFEYLDRLKRSIHQPQLPPLISPLAEAQRLGPIPIASADWEEHYEEAVWVPSESH